MNKDKTVKKSVPENIVVQIRKLFYSRLNMPKVHVALIKKFNLITSLVSHVNAT